jgi:lysophospholipase L1-like esterase
MTRVTSPVRHLRRTHDDATATITPAPGLAAARRACRATQVGEMTVTVESSVSERERGERRSRGSHGSRLQPSDLRGWTRRILATAFVASAVLAALAIYEANSALSLLGLLAVAALHGTFGALLVGLVIELVHPESTDLGRRNHLWMVVGIAVVGIGVVFVDAVARPRLSLGPTAQAWYLGASVGSALVAGVASYLVFSPKHLPGRRERLGVWSLAAMGGMLLGTGMVLILVVAPALYRDWRRPHITPDLAVSGIEGDYVALGDSYSAGEGLRPFNPYTESDAGDGCHRSMRAYSQLIRFEGGQPSARFPACSSAVTADIYDGFVRDPDGAATRVPAQVAGAPDPDVGLVTITIGGNDVVFSRVVRHCLLETACMTRHFDPPSHPRVAYPPAQPLLGWADEALDTLSENVGSVYGRLRESYPEARIIVIGYPHLFPADDPTWWPDCKIVLRRVSGEERATIRDLTDQLNTTLYARAVEAGIEFVSPAAAWDGHEPCGDAGQYTNAVKLIADTSVLDGGTFHPNEDGQRQLAAVVACYLGTWPDGPPDARVEGADGDLALSESVASPGDVGLVDPPGSVERPMTC